MEIKVLGTGCASCKALYATVEQVVKELALEAVIWGAYYAFMMAVVGLSLPEATLLKKVMT